MSKTLKVARKRKTRAKKSVKKTYIALVLDKSGSMQACQKEAMDGFNAQLDTILENAALGGETTISLLTFNHVVSVLQEAKHPDCVEKLNSRNYSPDGSTAMYDAVWRAINLLEKYDDGGRDTAFLVITISDGMENASKDVTSEQLAKKIQELQLSERWTFAYVGANQDLSQVQQALSICYDNVANYTATATGYNNMAVFACNAAAHYLQNRSQSITSTANYWSNNWTDNCFNADSVDKSTTKEK